MTDEKTENTDKQEEKPASMDLKTLLFEEDGKRLKGDAFKLLQPYIDSEKSKHADSLLKKYVPKEEFDKISGSLEVERSKIAKERLIEREISKHVNDDVLEDVLKMFDLDKIEMTDGKIIGLTDLVENIKTKKPSLFKKVEEKKTGEPIPKKATTGNTQELTREELNKMSMKERMDYLRKKEQEKKQK